MVGVALVVTSIFIRCCCCCSSCLAVLYVVVVVAIFLLLLLLYFFVVVAIVVSSYYLIITYVCTRNDSQADAKGQLRMSLPSGPAHKPGIAMCLVQC